MGRRVRQHVNPLAIKYSSPRAVAVSQPSHLGPACAVDVELGCADGQFSFQLAESDPSRFVVGLEIRDKVVDINRRKVKAAGLTNLAFSYVNMNVDLDRVFTSRSVDRFHILFPDPWFKARHHKRRVVELGLCETMAKQLRVGGELHFASDVYEVALEALSELEAPDVAALGFRNLAGPWSFWRGNPYPAASKREDTTLSRGQRVWRIRYRFDPVTGLSP